MNNEITIFNNSEFGEIRTLETDDGKVLFCGADVAKAFGYTNSRKALADHCKEKGVTKCDTLTNGGVQELTYIDEGNVYRLITHSKLPNAERFEAWVFDEILPTIRKTGSYIIPERNLEDKKDNGMIKFSVNTLMEIAKADFIDSSGKVRILAKISEMLTGEPLISHDDIIICEKHNKTSSSAADCNKSVPKLWYTATDIGRKLGVSAQKIGRLANRYDMKTSEYGEYVKINVPTGEVPVFRYYENAIPRFRELLSPATAEPSENTDAKKWGNFVKKENQQKGV